MNVRKQGRRFVPAGAEQRAPLRIAVAGYGYWGPNLVRNVVDRPELELAALCERDESRAAAFRERVSGVPVFSDFDEVLADDSIDAVLVATPPRTHHTLAGAALRAGKHVLVEKPLARTVAEAADLIDIANERSLVLMPGHTFLYSPPVNKVRELMHQGALGEVYFVTSSRMNLGKYQPDGVICDLAPHDVSILLYLLDQPVTHVSASARSIFREHNPEVAFITLTFASGVTANVQISWLAPRKVREMVFVGSRRMVQYDDTAADESVRVFDRGMEFEDPGELRGVPAQLPQRGHHRPARGGGRAAQPGAAGLRARHPHGRPAALTRAARPRDGRRDRGGRALAPPQRRADHARAFARAGGRLTQRS